MTPFYEKIYELCSKIPRGKVSTYASLARAAKTRAYRAVGQAMKYNTQAPIIPCHRVVLSSGKVGNYSGPGGQKEKVDLLRSEGVEVNNGTVDLNKFLHRF